MRRFDNTAEDAQLRKQRFGVEGRRRYRIRGSFSSTWRIRGSFGDAKIHQSFAMRRLPSNWALLLIFYVGFNSSYLYFAMGVLFRYTRKDFQEVLP
jgi:hypothetical protein